jgi:predicted amidohydrolase
MAFTFGDPKANLQRVKVWALKAKKAKADILLYPELWASGYDLKHCEDYAQPLAGGMFQEMAALAQEHSLVIGGSLLEKDQEGVFNTFALFGKDGRLIDYYRKIHLFRLLDEEKSLQAGEELVLANTTWGKVGLSVCYDLRFPEMFRAYAVAGVKLILLVAEWPETRIEHWRTLLLGRAVENQVYLAAVNKVGESRGVVLGGRSAIIDPWGERVIEGGKEESLLTAEIDLGKVDQARKKIPVLWDRNPGAYENVRGSGHDSD